MFSEIPRKNHENRCKCRWKLSKNDDSLQKLEDNKDINEIFGEDVIKSYIKLRNQEIDNFNLDETFDKNKPVTDWEKKNTLDC